MVWYGVASSMIRAVGYDADKRILDVAFHLSWPPRCG